MKIIKVKKADYFENENKELLNIDKELQKIFIKIRDQYYVFDERNKKISYQPNQVNNIRGSLQVLHGKLSNLLNWVDKYEKMLPR